MRAWPLQLFESCLCWDDVHECGGHSPCDEHNVISMGLAFCVDVEMIFFSFYFPESEPAQGAAMFIQGSCQ